MAWLLVVHVAAAMVYVGGHLLETMLLYRYEDVGGRRHVFRAIRAGEPAINIAAPVRIVTGVVRVILDASWSFTSPFVLIGIGVILFSTVFGLPILREMKSLAAIMDEHGVTEEVRRRYRRLNTNWSALGVVYLIAVWAMVIKP